MADPLLTLQTLDPERPTIRVDGVLYDLALPDDFGLIESARLARVLDRTRQAEEDVVKAPDDALSDEATGRLAELLDAMLGLIVRGPVGKTGGLPPAVVARMNSGQKLQVLAAFDPAVRTAATEPGPSKRRSGRSTSVKQSPSSKRRTARRTGTACRSAS